LDRDKQPEAAACGNEADTVEQRPRDPIARRVEKDFAGDADHAGLDALRIGQKLAAHTRAAPVGGNQNIALGRRAVLEICNDASAPLFVTLEGLGEMHVVELRQQHLAQRDAARGAVAGDRIGARNKISVERKQQAHLFGEKAHCRGRRPAGPVEDLEQMRRQALIQGEAAGWADAHSVALQAVGRGSITLVDSRGDPVALETLRESESADAAADDQDMEWFGHLTLL